MKEYIERAAVHELVNRLPKYQMFNYDRTESRRGISPDDVDFGVDKIPAADVVEVVRCRECENYDENGDCISLDLRIGIHSDTINYDFCPDPDFYCAYGRRKIETVLPKSDAKNESLEEIHANTRKTHADAIENARVH